MNGNWGPWSARSDCSVTCGVGQQIQTRQCDNPTPKYGGHDCPGENTQTLLCTIQKNCPGETRLSDLFFAITLQVHVMYIVYVSIIINHLLLRINEENK